MTTYATTRTGWTFPLTLPRVVMLLLVAAAFGTLAWRFYAGLGASTNLRDDFPWGLWIGLDIMTGVALAAGGFTMAFYIEVIGRERFHQFLRPAVLTAFVGYILVTMGILGDVGLPWRIYHPIYLWNPRSFMFEVAWCVMLYTTVLFVEFLPMPLERLGPGRLLRMVRKVMPVFIVLGIVLSTLHQSSLGSLFLLMGHRLHPLWWSPILPVNFLLTAICVGFAMVVFESILSGWLLKHPLDGKLLGDLTRPLPWLLLVALAVRLGDLVVRGSLSAVTEGSLQSYSFLVEVSIGLALPALLLFSRSWRETPGRLFTIATMVVLGVVLNRVNVSMIGMFTETSSYIPAWSEWVVSVGLVALGVLAVVFIDENVPVRNEHHHAGYNRPKPNIDTGGEIPSVADRAESG
jgi:Ni/Fe-hydrogenase subunit HybB-like protein